MPASPVSVGCRPAAAAEFAVTTTASLLLAFNDRFYVTLSASQLVAQTLFLLE